MPLVLHLDAAASRSTVACSAVPRGTRIRMRRHSGGLQKSGGDAGAESPCQTPEHETQAHRPTRTYRAAQKRRPQSEELKPSDRNQLNRCQNRTATTSLPSRNPVEPDRRATRPRRYKPIRGLSGSPRGCQLHKKSPRHKKAPGIKKPQPKRPGPSTSQSQILDCNRPNSAWVAALLPLKLSGALHRYPLPPWPVLLLAKHTADCDWR